MADLFTLIFEGFLKIDPILLTRYTNIQDQLLYLVLIPHVILLLFLWTFGIWIARGHPKFHILLSIVGYIYVVWSGLYGTFLIPFMVNMFSLMLILAFGFFILSYIIHPARGPAMYKLAGSVGETIGERTVGKMRKRKALEKQEDLLRSQIRELESRPQTRDTIWMINQLRMKLKEIEKELE